MTLWYREMGGPLCDVGAANPFSITPESFQGFSGNVILQATNDLTVNSAIDLTNSGNTLILQAGEDLTINADITSSGGANNLIFEADSSHTSTPDGSGTFQVDNNISIHSGGGNITMIAAAFDIQSDASIAAGVGNINLADSRAAR